MPQVEAAAICAGGDAGCDLGSAAVHERVTLCKAGAQQSRQNVQPARPDVEIAAFRHIPAPPTVVISGPMCQRYALPDQQTVEREFLPATGWWKFAAKFNVAAANYVPAIRLHEGQSEGVMMRWGLIPSWAEGKPTPEPALTIRSARIEKSNVYREPWLNSQRCILPIAGFYAWQLTDENYRQPYFVRLIDRSVFGVAAIWDRSVTEDDDVIESCSIICLPPNGFLSDIATAERKMPAILRRKDYETWLKGTPAAAKSLLQPYRPEWMEAYPVSPRINSKTADDASLIRPLH
jgi:putative SOS response-associated peptidase YedK